VISSLVKDITFILLIFFLNFTSKNVIFIYKILDMFPRSIYTFEMHRVKSYVEQETVSGIRYLLQIFVDFMSFVFGTLNFFPLHLIDMKYVLALLFFFYSI